VDQTARRDLEILNSLAEGHPVSQRALARRLGIALGLTNLYLKRLARKGYIKVTTIPPRRIAYLVTPRGFTRKARLTYEYMTYSLRLYRGVRETVQAALAPLAQNGVARVALYGTGEAAELAYLTLRELGIQPVAILDERPGQFLGYPVRDVREVEPGECDCVVVALLGPPDAALAHLERRGVGLARVVTLDRRLAGRPAAPAPRPR
jgi:DNA-binding MarR family transcriptional regulator